MKTLLPYFKNNKVIAPPEGYFILPGHICPSKKMGDVYYLSDDKWQFYNKWQLSGESGDDSKRTVKYLTGQDCYARPIKGNEELYNKMAFLPEQIVTPPEGFYIVGPNEKTGNILAYHKVDKEWKMIIGSDLETVKQHYDTYNKSFIAFARKIEKPENMKKEYSKHGFNVKIDSQKQFDRISKLANKYELFNASLTFDYCIQASKQDHFYLLFLFKNDLFHWNPTPFEANKNDVYEKWTYKDIEEHFKIICKKVDYVKYINFQVKVKNNKEFREVEDLAIKYGYDPIGLNYSSNYNIIQFTSESNILKPKSLTWSPKEFKPEEYYYYPNFDKEVIENHLKAVTDINDKVEIDYSKYPKFQIFISNEEEYKEAQNIAVKYGYVASPHVFLKPFYFIIGFNRNIVEWNPYEYKPDINPEEYYTHRKFDSKLIEEHFKAITNNNKTENMNTQVENKIDYAKYPNFAVKVDNDNTRVMLLALAEKFGMKKFSPDFCDKIKGECLYFSKKDNASRLGWKKNEIRQGFRNCFEDKDTHIYEIPDWPAIIKHFEAKVIEEKPLPVLHCYTMSKYNGDGLVVFGCAKISVGLLRSILNAHNLTAEIGNRKLYSVILDSGKEITMVQIKEILNYVDWANKQ